MKVVASLVGLALLSVSAPALASDVSSDRHLARQSLTATATEHQPSRPAAKAIPCDCACGMTMHERAGAEDVRTQPPRTVRQEPGGH